MMLIFVCLLGFSCSLCAAERLDEDMAKALIVRQLLNLIEESVSPADSPEIPYALCTYRNQKLSQILETHLNGLSVRDRPIAIIDTRLREQVADCQAVFINRPNDQDLRWFLQNNLPQKTLFIINGRRYAARGFQVGLFLNQSQSFDIELNPDAFIVSKQTPQADLLKFAELTDSETETKIHLLRTLINYTDWPSQGDKLKDQAAFELCTFANKPFAVFVEHFARNKTFKGKPLKSRLVKTVSETKNCDALIMDELVDLDSLALLTERAKNQLLLIGNQSGLGELGVHYNIAPDNNDQSFEINLIAFEQSGHSPHFDLIDSGYVVDKDYPEFSRTLTDIIDLTRWPEGNLTNESQKQIPLCVYRNPELFAKLSRYIELSNKSGTRINRKQITPSEVDENALFTNCKALLLGKVEPKSRSKILLESNRPSLLLISEQNVKPPIPYHYQVLMEPRKIVFDIDIQRLKDAGFVPAQSLVDAGKTGKGDTQ